MAVVIPFAPQRRSRWAPACPLPPRTAEILFFTGVRYERVPEARPPAPKTLPPKSQPPKSRPPKTPAAGRARKLAARKSARRQPA